MAHLLDLDTRKVHPLKVPFTLIGRNQWNDIVLPGPYVSRFHGAIVHHEGSDYIVRFGKNAIYYPERSAIEDVCEADFIRESMGLVSASHFEARREQAESDVAPLPGRPKYENARDLEPLFGMLDDPESRGLIVSFGKKLEHEGIIALLRDEPHKYHRLLYMK